MSISSASEAQSLVVPRLRLSAFYFFWFAALGAVLPYWGLYLLELDFTEFQIGLIFALMMGAKMIAPMVWGWIADHYGARLLIIRIAAFGALLAFLLMTQAQTFWPMFGLTVIYAFFWNAALPQFEAITFTLLGKDEGRYGRIRLWGSVGFIVSVLGLAPLVQHWGIHWLLVWVTAMLAGILGSSLLLNVHSSRIQPVAETVEGFWSVLKQREVLSLLLVCFLAQLSHGPYYTFFSIYLKSVGYSEEWIGFLWALGVAAEIGVFIALPKLMAGFGAYRLMSLALFVTALRWVLLAYFAESVVMLFLIQIMHLATFGIYHAVAVTLIHRQFTGRLQGRGQALYSAISFGAGGALGAGLSGYFWAQWSPATIYLAAALCAFAAWLICLLGMSAKASSIKT